MEDSGTYEKVMNGREWDGWHFGNEILNKHER